MLNSERNRICIRNALAWLYHLPVPAQAFCRLSSQIGWLTTVETINAMRILNDPFLLAVPSSRKQCDTAPSEISLSLHIFAAISLHVFQLFSSYVQFFRFYAAQFLSSAVLAAIVAFASPFTQTV